MAVLYIPHFIQFFDDNGDPLSGGKLYTYAAGTTTPKATYTTEAATVQNANPVVLDSSGRAVVFLSGSYKFRLEDSLGNLIRETDNVTAFSVQSSTVDDIITNFTEDVITAADSVIFADVSDGNETKRDTVQGILDLMPSQKRVLQHDYDTSTATSSTATTIPADNTIPQSTEGAEGMTSTFTPTSATSKLCIWYGAMLGSSSASASGALCLFKDSETDARDVTPSYISNGGANEVAGYYEMTSGTTSAITFKLRFGASGGTTYFNSLSGTGLYGGVAPAFIKVIEVEA